MSTSGTVMAVHLHPGTSPSWWRHSHHATTWRRGTSRGSIHSTSDWHWNSSHSSLQGSVTLSLSSSRISEKGPSHNCDQGPSGHRASPCGVGDFSVFISNFKPRHLESDINMKYSNRTCAYKCARTRLWFILAVTFSNWRLCNLMYHLYSSTKQLIWIWMYQHLSIKINETKLFIHNQHRPRKSFI